MPDAIATRKRSLVMAFTYRVIIICLDFVVVRLLTGKTETAVGFMIISNLYTTVAYFLHERLWSRIKWGLTREETNASR
jgi:adenylylsulfate kinase